MGSQVRSSAPTAAMPVGIQTACARSTGPLIASTLFPRALKKPKRISGMQIPERACSLSAARPERLPLCSSVGYTQSPGRPMGQRIVSSAEQTVQVWDARTGAVLGTYNFSARVQTVAWSPDGTCLASRTEDEVQIHGALVSTFPLTQGVIGGPVVFLRWSPDGASLACVDGTGIQIWYATSQQAFLLYATHATIVKELAWSPNSKYIAFPITHPHTETQPCRFGKSKASDRSSFTLLMDRR